jgi:hypothetical protein
MASDLIPAVCPNCGGKLQVDPGADTLICQYCNTEHIIRRTVDGAVNLEAFARCPLCRRNDQVEKISAILKKQTSQSDGYVPQQEIYTDSDGHAHSRTVNVRVQTTHKTDLAQGLNPPELARPKEPSSRPTWMILGCAIILFISIGCSLVYAIAGMLTILFNQSSSPPNYSYLFASACATAAMLIPVGLFFLWKSSKKKDEARVNQELSAYQQAYQQWQQAMARYENLYYCGRDDVVFIPGEKTSANVADLMRYIYTNPGG